jgi:hypothetical protein
MKTRFLITMWLVLCTLLAAEEKQENHLQKSAVKSTKYFDINRIKSAIRNDGIFARHPITGNADFYFDRDQLIYTLGLWIAAKVNGEIRASAADYLTDWVGGAIDEYGNPFGKEDSTFRIYKISRGDNAINNPDYAEWPIELGAPSDGQDNPLLIGDQTLWGCFVDSYIDDRIHNHCLPLGAEVHLTAWGWEEIDNVIFLRWEIINKSDENWEECYFGIYSDPDLFDAGNDLTASDSTLNLVYCYDGRSYYMDFPYHAAGYQILESPIISSPGDTAITFLGEKFGFKNVPVYSPRMEKNMGLPDGRWNDIPYNELAAPYIYNRLRCLNFIGEPAIDPIANLPSNWIFSGDPVTGSGWIETVHPRDRRMMPSTGPITLAPGDTSFITMAIIATSNKDQRTNIVDLKNDAHFIRDAFRYRFKVRAKTNIEIEHSSSTESKVSVKAHVRSEILLSSVQAKFYTYHDELIHVVDLFDDGAHFDEMANDSIYGNAWLATPRDEPLYLNVIISDLWGNQYRFERTQSYITLSSQINFEIQILGDHLNHDGKANPGENLRLGFELANNYPFDLGNVSLSITSIDPHISFNPVSFYLDSIKPGMSKQTDYNLSDRYSYLTFDIPSGIPDTHKIALQAEIYEQGHRHWTEVIQIPLLPFDYVPNEIIPTQISGKSDASFVVRILDPNELTGHSYMIAICDSINEKKDKGFHLIDQSLADTALFNSPAPDKYAYNIPVTNGFKVIYGDIPKGGFKEVLYIDIEAGHPAGFEGVNFGGTYFNNGISLGLAAEDEFYHVELEFTNSIDSTGVIGLSRGQNAFRYEYTPNTNPTGFLPCPFHAWKIVRGEGIGRLNACFIENPYLPTFDNTWAPDASQYGGFEVLYIMSSNYDSTGQLYMGKKIDLSNVLFKVHLRLKSATSLMDAGDKMVFNWEYPATTEDKFVFIPTQIEARENPALLKSFELFQNYPNPFNHTTQIRFSMHENGQVQLNIFNLQGQLVKKVIDEVKQSGTHQILWDGTDQSNQPVCLGLYFYQFKMNNQVHTKKMLLLK